MVKLKIKVGPKGQILIPKVFREKYGLEEGESAIIEPRDDGILLKGRPSIDDILAFMKEHVAKLKSLGVVGSKPGDLKQQYLEMEFEESSH